MHLTHFCMWSSTLTLVPDNEYYLCSYTPLLLVAFRSSHPLSSRHHDSVFGIIQTSRWASPSLLGPHGISPLSSSSKGSQDPLLSSGDDLSIAFVRLALECLLGISNGKPHLGPVSHLPTRLPVPPCLHQKYWRPSWDSLFPHHTPGTVLLTLHPKSQ